MWYGPTEGRRLSLSDKKARGVRRRLRWLDAWACRAGVRFPADLEDPARGYLHTKIPVLQNLVEGRRARRRVQKACAQALIDACTALIASKPSRRAAWRVTCMVCLPDMFSSELCIYTDEEYFRSHTGAGDEGAAIRGRSLAAEWRLHLPPGVVEVGRRWAYSESGDAEVLESEHWHFGEVGQRAWRT